MNGIIGLGMTTFYMNQSLAGDYLVNFWAIYLGLIFDVMT